MSEQEEKDFEAFKKLWWSRNPQHELNADTDEDMFYKTAFMVCEDYANEKVKAKKKVWYRKLHNKLFLILEGKKTTEDYFNEIGEKLDQ